MIGAGQFLAAAASRGYDFYTGVPCSFLTPLINYVVSGGTDTYVAAASEGEAVALAAGAWLGGRQSVVMCQNSGLGNTVNPLTSLNAPFRIPSLLIVTWRGQPGLHDEPQHELMGRITHELLATMEIAHAAFPTDADRIDAVLDEAASAAEQGRCYALVMQRGSVRETGLEHDDFRSRARFRLSDDRDPNSLANWEPEFASSDRALAPGAVRALPPGQVRDFTECAALPSRMQLLERLLGAAPPEAAIIATTGKCGRELFTIADREQHLYQVGSMGCASGMGLGVALTTSQPVIVLDGDGAALMKLGTLATIGAYQPGRLLHVIMDNGSYDSTGGQPTSSHCVDFAGMARCCGYSLVFRANSAEGFQRAVALALAGRGPALIHARMRPGSMAKLGRPTVKPPEVARRFKAFLARYRPF
ncbi:MAG: phosphonopyruvate decarboxylase [Acetobacteraceae bacterium]|nr:phosphonopyruvate decarboxylase [Acetobacteraceae bacterium]